MPHRTRWRGIPDGFRLLVPASWSVPNARPVNAVRNRGLTAGELSATPAKVKEVLAAGLELPHSLFSASGTLENGTAAGIAVSAYRIESSDLPSLREQILEAAPGSAIKDVTFNSRDGLRVEPSPDGNQDGRSFVDYWAPVQHRPGRVAVLCCWTDGAMDWEFANHIAATFGLMDPTFFCGFNRPPALSHFRAPDGDDRTAEGFRFAGWRLGSVFEGKVLPRRIAAAAAVTPKKSDALVILLLFLGWLAVVAATVGFHRGVLMLGTMSTMSALPAAQRIRSRAVVALFVTLAVLLAVGIATS